MAIADDLKPLLTSIRAIPGQFGLRPYTVSAVIRAYSGTYAGEGTKTDTTVAITEANGQPPKVRFLNDEELALGDNLGKGTIEVGPITPDHTGGGTTIAALTGGSAIAGDIVHFVITGPEYPNGARFRLVGVSSDRALHYKVRLAPVDGNV
jgi:hypothetical protein